MRELIERLKSETPKWFKKIIYWAIGVGATCGSLKLYFAEASVTVSPLLEKIIEYGIVAGGVAAVVAKTACQAPPEPKKKKPKDGLTA